MPGSSVPLVAVLAVVVLACLAPFEVLGSGIGKCTYDKDLGFNPFERWTAVALDDKLEADQGSFEGRIAGKYITLSGTPVNTNPKQFSPKADTPWAVTAVEGHKGEDGQPDDEEVFFGTDWQGKSSTIHGGVEALGKIVGSVTIEGDVKSVRKSAQLTGEISGKVQSKEASTITSSVPVTTKIVTSGLKLSVDFPSVKSYFTDLSIKMAELEESVLAIDKLVPRTVTITLRSKVNVVNTITAEELKAIDKIVLKGHPKGILIINIDDQCGNGCQLTVGKVVYEAAGVQSDAAFGRVLVNYPKAKGAIILEKPMVWDGGDIGGGGLGGLATDLATAQKEMRAARTQDVATIERLVIKVSLLAPMAYASVSTGMSDLQGNIIARTITFNHAKNLIQPFASLPRGGGSTGGSKPPGDGAWACWWGLL